MREFYRAFPPGMISETLSRKLAERPMNNAWTAAANAAALPAAVETFETPSRKSAPFDLRDVARAFPLPSSDYVLLVRRARSPEALAFYHTEALRRGWSVRQLQRQMENQFYERTGLSRDKAAMLAKGAKAQPGDAVSADEDLRLSSCRTLTKNDAG